MSTAAELPRDGASIAVANVRGWRRRTAQAGDVLVCRPSALGNPFKIGPGQARAQVIEAYRGWLARALDRTPGRTLAQRRAAASFAELLKRARAGEPIRLLCYCAPAPCHADVIRELLLENLQ